MPERYQFDSLLGNLSDIFSLQSQEAEREKLMTSFELLWPHPIIIIIISIIILGR